MLGGCPNRIQPARIQADSAVQCSDYIQRICHGVDGMTQSCQSVFLQCCFFHSRFLHSRKLDAQLPDSSLPDFWISRFSFHRVVGNSACQRLLRVRDSKVALTGRYNRCKPNTAHERNDLMLFRHISRIVSAFYTL